MNKQQQNLFSTDPEPWELDDAADRLAVEVVFAQPPHGPFDYWAPDGLRGQVQAGCRVRVPLGRGDRSVVGYCVRLSGPKELARRPDRAGGAVRRLKEIEGLVDGDPLLSPSMLRLTEWMADYYLCPWGQVLEAVLPAGVRGRAGSRQTTFLTAPASVVARLDQWKLPPKQAEALRILADSPQPLTPPQLAAAAHCTQAPIRALRKKNFVRAEVRRVPPGALDEPPAPRRRPQFQLNKDQRTAVAAVLAALRAGRHETLLLHGVTGSGKTEVYIRAIEEVIRFGRQAIVLVPEISLTPQTCQRFRSRFDRVAVLHSHLTDVQRHGHWRRIADGEVQVVVGARSAVFAPAPHLGLMVLDEEHDGSFKQDLAPRYHAREIARRRTEAERVPLVLGSATPSLESWRRACDRTYRLLQLPRRVLNRPLPHVAAIDLRDEYRSRRTRGGVSRPLHDAIDQSLREDGQVILLLNRRGFSTSIQCPACGHVVRCPQCDIALTHHHHGEKALCHYCDYQIAAPSACPECSFEAIRYSGLGTQRLEAEVRAQFPGVSCLRMDSDSMRKPGSHERALARFRAGDVRILLGTQMIAKGLDFPNVTLVGVVNADTALHLPDFRAAERTFQLVTQVAGRTGRGDKGGHVLVQTFTPDHTAIQAALRHDYEKFAALELAVRKQFGYPPMAAMIRVIVRGEEEADVEAFAEKLADGVRAALESDSRDVRLVGPAPAPIGKLRGSFRHHMLLLGPRGERLRRAVREAAADCPTPRGVLWTADVDPLDML